MIKISRTGVEDSLHCKRCFVLKHKHKLRLDSFPFTLNIAIDNLCKNEFDHYREKEQPHPLFVEHNIDALPFKHPEMDNWRNFRKGGVYFKNENKGYHFWGAVDDVWQQSDGKLILSDIKSTAKNKFDWEETWTRWDYPKAYKRQLEMYQWLFRQNGFDVSNTAYLVYYNGLKNEPMFNQTLKFQLHLVKLECNDDWVENAILNAKTLLEQDELPRGSKRCDTCQYLKKRWSVNQSVM